MKSLKVIINQIKLFSFSAERKEFYFLMKSFLGYSPINLELYELSLSSKSLACKNKQGEPINNERLEFLGDCILDTIVASYLYDYYPEQNEGKLTDTKSKIVKRETLNEVATKMGLPKLIFEFSNKELNGNHIYGNALEALIGAIFLDKGYQFTQAYVMNKIILKYIPIEQIFNKNENYKSQLLEWGQKHKIKISFEIIDEQNLELNQKRFRTQILLNNDEFEVGMGISKKESQQMAAKYSLNRLKRKENYYLDLYKEYKEEN